ncbi:MAG: ATP-binding cassette domain-containing protein [Burkholderiales bacterium]|jgi:oligopeptide transport system ATP-binding protein|nr:ATP-binding cassette domain-containing protein [Burkholderiales bacterium]MBP9768233.1 ATP-binding cassette domain-containing protein [Burkholderiales bacterium]
MKKILEVKNLKVHFELSSGLFKPKKVVHAVDGIDFEVFEGETLGIVGESGCGKSSLARALCGLNKITSGSALFNGIDLAKASAKQWDEVHKQMQFIFQDPVAALDPRMTVAEIIAEPLVTLYPNMKQTEVMAKVFSTMKLVGLSQNQVNRYPQEFSGGQCQRIGIARALILEPKVLICDESVSALDVSIKAQIINLLQELQQKLKLTILFISHDLGVIKHICNRILVMYLGNIMELGAKKTIYSDPLHPYTKALLSAVPVANPELEKAKVIQLLEGELPSPVNPPHGCVFHTRCPLASEACSQSRPDEKIVREHSVSCFKVN